MRREAIGLALPNAPRDPRAVTTAINASGEAQFACPTWRGQRVMRVSVSGWANDTANIDRTVNAIATALNST